jgi:hypothetical protein
LNIKYELNITCENFKEFLLNIKNYFIQSSQSIHKARNELKIIEFENTQTVVKAFKVPNKINQLVYAYFRDSKAKKSYLNALELQRLKINTPKPIGYIEFFKYGLFKESFFISQKCDYAFSIREPLRNKTLKDREKIIESFVMFTYNLHQNNVYHKDYSAGNTLVIQNEDNSYDFSIVDINRMEFKPIDLALGLDNFAKLWLDEENIQLISKTYAKLANVEQDKAYNLLKFSDKKLKDFVKFKRKIRGKE